MNDKNKLISENELPITVPATDLAWKDMRNRLEEEMPDAAIVPAIERDRPFRKSTLLLLLLLLALLAGFAIFQISGNNTGNKTNSVSVEPTKNGKLPDDMLQKRIPGQAGTEHGGQNSRAGTNSTAPAIDLHQDAAGARQENASATVDPNTSLKRNTTKKSKSKNQLLVKNTAIKTRRIQNDNNPQTKRNAPVPQKDNGRNAFVPGDSNIASQPIRTLSLDSTAAKKNTLPKADSIAVNTPAKGSRWQLQAGINWSLQVPVTGSHAYWSGANTTAQPYRVLLPGAWLQASTEKDLLTLEVNPFATNLTPSKTFRTFTTVENIPDTIVMTTQTRSLHKLFGVTAGLGYSHHISGNWWLGGNLQASFWNKAVASTSGEIKKSPVNGSPAVVTTFKKSYSLDDEWNYFSKFQFYLQSEAVYRKPSWQAGLRLGMAVTPLSRNEGPGYSLRLELLYRLKLFGLKLDADKKKAGSWNK